MNYLLLFFTLTAFANVSKKEYIQKTIPLVSGTVCHPLVNESLIEVCYGINYALCVHEFSLAQQSCAMDMEKVLPDQVTTANNAPYASTVNKCGLRRMALKFQKKMKPSEACKKIHADFTQG